LLENGATIDTKERFGETPLHQAAGKDRKAVVRLLLEKGTDVMIKNVNGRASLGPS
jgi:ankyrin repeat protein